MNDKEKLVKALTEGVKLSVQESDEYEDALTVTVPGLEDKIDFLFTEEGRLHTVRLNGYYCDCDCN